MARNRYTLHHIVGNPSEWSYTWHIEDDIHFRSHCEFCMRTMQRLTYQVTRGDQVAWICLNCVSRYNLSAKLDGFHIGPRAARSYVHGLTARIKQQTCSDIICRTHDALPDAGIEEVIVYFDRNLQLSPLHAGRLFSALVQNGEKADVRIFDIQTRSNAHHLEFGALTDHERRLVWVALSSQQRHRMAKLGFAPQSTSV